MRKEKHMVPILVWWLSEGLHLLCYQDAVLCLFTTSHLCSARLSMLQISRMGGTQGRESRYRARPQVDLVKQLIRVLSSILAGWYFPSLPCAQPHAPPAYHYQASGPYCITDGADRRERRQPACILELQLSERRGREGESKRERKCNFSLSRWWKMIWSSAKWKSAFCS